MTKRNGTLRNVGIVVGILLAVGTIIWSFAIQSGSLDHVIKDIVTVKAESTKTNGRVKKVEEAVILIQSDIGYIKRDVAKILEKIEGE